jgi:hypothetical protein
VVLNGHLEAFSQNSNKYFIPGFPLGDDTNPGTRGFSINESEVNFQANIDLYLFGNLTAAFEPNNTISIEEAFMQTTSLPAGFTLRAGRFFSAIGYLNASSTRTPGTSLIRRCPIGLSSIPNMTKTVSNCLACADGPVHRAWP